MLETGSMGPAFALFSHDGNMVQLSRLLERQQRLVVYFFLQAGAPGCTREACGFRDAREELAARGVAVVGISTDPVAALAQFATENKIDFPLLSDPDHTICEEWGAWRGQGVGRVSYVLDGSGLVTHVYPRVDVNKHAADIVALFGEAAPTAPSLSGVTEEMPLLSVAVHAADVDALIVGAGRATLELLVAHVEAGHALPDDMVALAARLSRR